MDCAGALGAAVLVREGIGQLSDVPRTSKTCLGVAVAPEELKNAPPLDPLRGRVVPPFSRLLARGWCSAPLSPGAYRSSGAIWGEVALRAELCSARGLGSLTPFGRDRRGLPRWLRSRIPATLGEHCAPQGCQRGRGVRQDVASISAETPSLSHHPGFCCSISHSTSDKRVCLIFFYMFHLRQSSPVF